VPNYEVHARCVRDVILKQFQRAKPSDHDGGLASKVEELLCINKQFIVGLVTKMSHHSSSAQDYI
jgi:hypothetical protein